MEVHIISFTSVIGDPVGIASASFTLGFSLTTGIIKKLLNITRKKKNNHGKILVLAKSKLSSIETLVSQSLIGMEISHEDFIATLKKKGKYEKVKENLMNGNEKKENMKWNSVNSRT